jgi:hypothetical protein
VHGLILLVKEEIFCNVNCDFWWGGAITAGLEVDLKMVEEKVGWRGDCYGVFEVVGCEWAVVLLEKLKMYMIL